MGAMAEATTHLTPYQFGANSPVMYNDPTGLLVSGAGYVARPGLQRGVDGYYKAPWEAEFEWNDEGFFDWYNHGVGGGNYSSINGITTKQVLSISPGEVQRYYEKLWAGTGRTLTNVRQSPTRSGFDVGYANYSNRPDEVIVGTMFVSTVKMKEHLRAAEAMSAGFTLNNVNESLNYAGYLEGGIGATQLGMLNYRTSLSMNNKIGTFRSFSRGYGSLSKIRGGLGTIGYASAGVNTYVDYNSMRNGEISGGRFAYRTYGTYSSMVWGTVIGSELGGPWGAVAGTTVGGGFWATEMMYDGYMQWRQQMSAYLANFENALRSGWLPGR